MPVGEEGAWLSGTLLPSRSPWLGMSCETLRRPPSPCSAMTRLGQVQKSGVSWERSASCGQSRRQPIHASLLPAAKVEVGGCRSSFSSLEGLKYGGRRAPLEDLGLGEEGCPQDMGFCVSPGCGCCDRMGQGVVPRLGKALFGGGSPQVPGPASKSGLQAQLAPPQPVHVLGLAPCAGTHVQTAGWPSPGDSAATLLLATALTASEQ